jgi:hypothetical protein
MMHLKKKKKTLLASRICRHWGASNSIPPQHPETPSDQTWTRPASVHHPPTGRRVPRTLFAENCRVGEASSSQELRLSRSIHDSVRSSISLDLGGGFTRAVMAVSHYRRSHRPWPREREPKPSGAALTLGAGHPLLHPTNLLSTNLLARCGRDGHKLWKDAHMHDH